MPLALVTGAGIRVGRAVALGLARDGHDVIVHAHRSVAEAQQTAEAIRALGRQAFVEYADLTQDDGVEAFGARVLENHPVLDVLVHSAAGFERVPFPQITRSQYRVMQALNLEAPFFLTQKLLPALERAEDPSVIHIVDIAAERAMNRYAHYSVSKAGLWMLTKALAVELGPKVRVNGVSPGAVAFPDDFSTELKDNIVRRIPLKREGSPDDIAQAVVYLVHAQYVSGSILPVDGGRHAVF